MVMVVSMCVEYSTRLLLPTTKIYRLSQYLLTHLPDRCVLSSRPVAPAFTAATDTTEVSPILSITSITRRNSNAQKLPL